MSEDLERLMVLAAQLPTAPERLEAMRSIEGIRNANGSDNPYITLSRGGAGRGFVHKDIVLRARAEADALRAIRRMTGG